MRTVKEVGRNYAADIDIPSANIDYVTTTVTSSTSITQDSGLSTFACNATSGNINISLPTAAGNQASFLIKKIDSSSNLVSIDPYSSETIDGESLIYLYDQYNYIQIQSDGTNWIVNNEFYSQKWT